MKKTVLLLVAALATNVSTYASRAPSSDVEEWPGMQEAIAKSMQTHREEEDRRLAQKLQDEEILAESIQQARKDKALRREKEALIEAQNEEALQMGIAESMQTHREKEARRAAQASEITPANHEAGRQAITLHEISQVREQLQNIASDTKITQITIAGRDLPIRRFNGQIFVQIPTNGAGINMCPLMSLGPIPASTREDARGIATLIAANLQKHAANNPNSRSHFSVWRNGRNPAGVSQNIFDGNGINYSVLWHFLTGTEGHALLTDDDDPIWWPAMEEALGATIHILRYQDGQLIDPNSLLHTDSPRDSRDIYIFGEYRNNNGIETGHYSLLVPLPLQGASDDAFEQTITTIRDEIARNDRYIG